ncbi:MAG TPA: hypothetical protein DHW52_13350, partial [Alcanivorax sp.]|nr:hypothetical protein [Alcanivorax sp.]
EPMTDEQIKVFLDFPPEEGENPDFHVLLKAYRALRAEDFERFVAFFQAQNRDIRATDDRGRTLLDIVRGHGKSEPFVAILEKAGG